MKMRPSAVQLECTIIFGTWRCCAAWPPCCVIFSDMTLLRSSSALLHEVWQQHEFTLPELHRSAIPLDPCDTCGRSCTAATHLKIESQHGVVSNPGKSSPPGFSM
jgi:hypothetical protein